MFPRLLNKPSKSIFLFGPRGTGKSTWLHQEFPDATYYSLLDTKTELELLAEPWLLHKQTHTLPRDHWVVIDEVQKAPSLLNEVHRLIEERGLRFVLSGSSARSLRKAGVNLLAGRALQQHMYPLVSAEVNHDYILERVLQYGLLPSAFTAEDPAAYLQTYAHMYLNEEIKKEAFVRDLSGFVRFLEVAARQNGQLTNYSNIGREAHVQRKTVESYFEILVDTLLGSFLPPWKLKGENKQVSHAKFYMFDTGVVRALTRRAVYPLIPEEEGVLFETWIHQELKAYLSYSKKNYPLYFWRNYSGTEVDFFLETSKGYVAIECKYSSTWQRKFSRGLQYLAHHQHLDASLQTIGVFTGERALVDEGVHIYPYAEFCRRLWSNEIIQ